MKEGFAKLFIDNFLIYGLGNVIGKAVPVIMVPILTKLYPSPDYLGLNDLTMMIVSFAGSLSLCGMYDAVFRLYFDKADIQYRKGICSTALFFVLFTTMLLSLILFFFRETIAVLVFGDSTYKILVLLSIAGLLSSNLNSLISCPTRMENRRGIFLLTNTISPLISYSVALCLLLRGRYLTAIPIGTILSGLLVDSIYIILNHTWFSVRLVNKKDLCALLSIGVFLIPNFFIYWIYHSADRIMIGKLLGNSAVGLYSVAAKAGSISNLIYMAFSGGWLYVSYSLMQDRENTKIKSMLFEYLSAVVYASSVLLSFIIKPLWGMIFPEAYQISSVPGVYLFLAPMLLMLFQMAANQFTVVKKSYMNLLALTTGAIVNIILNLYLIPKLGIEGAAIATVGGYTVNLMMTVLMLKGSGLLVISRRYTLYAVLFGSYMMMWHYQNMRVSVPAGVGILMILFAGYRKEILTLAQKMQFRREER